MGDIDNIDSPDGEIEETVDEFEQRFLVRSIDPDIQRSPSLEIVQGYFETSPNMSFRVRVVNGQKAVMTRKTGHGKRRKEMNRTISVGTAKFMLEAAMCLQKTRYVKEMADGKWEIDFFHGPLSGLVLAEFESPDPDHVAVLPPWIHDAVEVTDTLTNRHLARLARDLEDSRTDRPVRDLLPRRLPHIVLTGGPCSGKSSLIRELQAEFGSRLHCVPEVASIVIAQVGVKPPSDQLGLRRFQRTLYRVQRGFETVSDLQAIRDGKQALLLDRGAIDGAAYMDGGLDEFERTCRTARWHEYAEYDLVICLATPPRDVYERECRKNPARSEAYPQAEALGKSIKRVWKGHPRFVFVPNEKSWKHKVKRVRRIIAEFLAKA